MRKKVDNFKGGMVITPQANRNAVSLLLQLAQHLRPRQNEIGLKSDQLAVPYRQNYPLAYSGYLIDQLERTGRSTLLTKVPMKPPRRFQRSQARNSGQPPGLDRKPEELVGMRLNKYLAHSGVASRRQCGDLVKAGKVKVNGEVQDNPAYQIQEGDEVSYRDKVVSPDEQYVYVLLNKPRNVITTTSDEHDRTTVMDLLEDPNLKPYRLFPVGRLDRETTGLLLITNDGDTAKRLTHPSHQVSKIYHATLNKPFSTTSLAEMEHGYKLEDGPFAVDWVRYAKEGDKMTVALQIHVGRNRIVRRAFEHLGYTVERLDRVYLAGLTKKNLPRGFYRFLTEEEVRMIRHFS